MANLADLDDFEMDVVSVLSPPLLTQTRQLATKAVPSAANPQENGDDDGAELAAASVLPRESVKVLDMVNAIEQRLQMPQAPHLRSTKTKPVPQADLKLADGIIEKLDDGGVNNDCLGAKTGKVSMSWPERCSLQQQALDTDATQLPPLPHGWSWHYFGGRGWYIVGSEEDDTEDWALMIELVDATKVLGCPDMPGSDSPSRTLNRGRSLQCDTFEVCVTKDGRIVPADGCGKPSSTDEVPSLQRPQLHKQQHYPSTLALPVGWRWLFYGGSGGVITWGTVMDRWSAMDLHFTTGSGGGPGLD